MGLFSTISWNVYIRRFGNNLAMITMCSLLSVLLSFDCYNHILIHDITRLLNALELARDSKKCCSHGDCGNWGWEKSTIQLAIGSILIFGRVEEFKEDTEDDDDTPTYYNRNLIVKLGRRIYND